MVPRPQLPGRFFTALIPHDKTGIFAGLKAASESVAIPLSVLIASEVFLPRSFARLRGSGSEPISALYDVPDATRVGALCSVTGEIQIRASDLVIRRDVHWYYRVETPNEQSGYVRTGDAE